jgi:hypothetical protein
MGQLLEVDPYADHLSTQESVALIAMLAKHRDYSCAGRSDDAHGLGTGIWILWRALLDFRDTIPTIWSEL